MIDWLLGHYDYFLIVLLLTIGLYGILAKRNLVKKLIGLNIFQTAIFLFFIEGAAKMGASVPVISAQLGTDPANYINPLPHVLILTGIVVAFSLTGVGLAFLITICQTYHSLDEGVIIERMSQ